MTNRKVIAVIGGGASGTIFALQAQRYLSETAEIIVIERSGVFGPGLAYSVTEPCFLLNVRADRMGAIEGNPAHFFEWIKTREGIWRSLHTDFKQINFAPHDFVPRMIYGAYLCDLFQGSRVESKGMTRSLHDQVSRIEPQGERLRIMLSSGTSLICDDVIFATGNSYSRLDFKPSNQIFLSPYHKDFWKYEWQRVRHVIIAGTGLSMVDTVIALKEKGYTGKITAVSRHGLVPLPHQSMMPVGAAPLKCSLDPEKISAFVRNIRDELSTENWQEKIDSLRPISNSLWKGLRPEQQKRLMRLGPWWSVARHRIPDFFYKTLQDLQREEKLSIIKDKICNVRENGMLLEIELSNGNILSADAFVNCTGFRYSSENIQKLCPDLQFNAHWMGGLRPVSNSDFRICAEHKIYALGPLLYGWNFESTAVHEIRGQAKLLAEEIIS